MGIKPLHPHILGIDISNSQQVGMLFGRRYRCVLTGNRYFCFLGRTLTRLRECVEQEYEYTSSNFLNSYNILQIMNLRMLNVLIPIDSKLECLIGETKRIADKSYLLRQMGTYRHTTYLKHISAARDNVLAYLIKYFSNGENPIWVINEMHTTPCSACNTGCDIAYGYLMKRRMIGNTLIVNVNSTKFATMPFRDEPEKIFSHATLSELIAYPQ
jgi:hypothetical protein